MKSSTAILSLFLGLLPVVAGGCEQVFWGPPEVVTTDRIYDNVLWTTWSTTWQGSCGEKFLTVFANTQEFDSLLEAEFEVMLFLGELDEDGEYIEGSQLLLSNNETMYLDGNYRSGYDFREYASLESLVWIKILDPYSLPHIEFTITIDDNEGPLGCTDALEMVEDVETEYISNAYVDFWGSGGGSFRK